jgi:carboxyl-terminal processing protease
MPLQKCSPKYITIILTTIISLCITTTLFATTKEQLPRRPDNSLSTQEVIRFGRVLKYVKHLYVGKVNDQKLFAGAISGMLKNLDPHSSYLDEQSLKNLQTHTKGDFAGIGIEVTQEKGLVKIVSPIDDTPAQKANLKPGDYILAVDSKSLIDMPLTKATKLMRGKKGTKITLTVINKQDKKPRKITLIRDIINIKSVKSELLDDSYGYIRISNFQSQTDENLIKAIKSLQKQAGGQLKGLILDLRNNPGGLLSSAIEVANIFLDSNKLGDNKYIVYTKGRVPRASKHAIATGTDLLYGTKLVVLINRGSASASEIVAGALQDHKRAIIMGERSFGKGSVQTVLPVDDKTAIKLTTSLYYTPKGRAIQAKGIKPDIAVQNLVFKKPKEEAIIFWKIREIDLKNHIKNGEEKKNSLMEQYKAKTLATKDYQLYEALRLLKTLHVLQKRVDT